MRSVWLITFLCGKEKVSNQNPSGRDVISCATLGELHDFLCHRIRHYFQSLIFNQSEHPVVFQIKEYIRQNFAVPTLSVLDISQYANRSSSYICTLFKNETGQTINQYLTDYRIKMSSSF